MIKNNAKKEIFNRKFTQNNKNKKRQPTNLRNNIFLTATSILKPTYTLKRNKLQYKTQFKYLLRYFCDVALLDDL